MIYGEINMARKTQISKDIILQVALEMLIEKGYASINIKTLAEKIGCSTQPIVWKFDNMEGVRNALADYALAYAEQKMTPKSNHPIEAFKQVGRAYIELAMHETNLFKFLYLEKVKAPCPIHLEEIITSKNNTEMIKAIANYLSLSEEAVGVYLRDTIIYTHGIATLIATGGIESLEEEVMKIIDQAADAFLLKAGVSMDGIPNG